VIVTTAQATEILGISKVRLNELARQGKIPRGQKQNQCDLEAVQAALGSNLDPRWPRRPSPACGGAPTGSLGRRSNEPPWPSAAAAPRPPEKGTLAHAILMHQQARAARAALEAQRLEGKLVPVREVEAVWAAMMMAIRNRMLLVPDRIAARVAAESSILECRDIVDRAVREALTAASEYEPNA
jgi:hypothetical protein